MTQRQPARGLGAVAVIMVLVVLASLAAAVVRLGQQLQTQTTEELQGAQARAAARAGLEWGLYQALKGSWTACSSASQTLDRSADGASLRVTVSCSSDVYNEGESTPGVPIAVRVFTIEAVACTSTNATTACPDNTAVGQAGYVERKRQVVAVN